MITGTLSKFESTNEGLTVIIKADISQLQAVVNLFRQEVTILPSQTEISADKASLLKDILSALDAIRVRVEKELPG